MHEQTMERLNISDRREMQYHRYYIPVQRVSQACQACRKRKARCSGEHPRCESCRRLARECVYPKNSRMPREPVHPGDGHDIIRTLHSSIQELSERMANIESILQSRMDIPRKTTPEYSSTYENGHQITPATDVNENISSDCGDLRGTLGSPSVDISSSLEALPDQVPLTRLLPAPVLLETVDKYFSYCHNQPYSLFHEPSFRRDLSQGQVPAYLLLAMLASAVRFSENPFFSDKDAIAQAYANKSWQSIVSSCFTLNKVDDIRIVQTLTLLSIFDFTAGPSRHGYAWVKVGLCVRIAQDLKLMMETTTHKSYPEQEERRRVFWSLFLLDRLISCGRARPPAILDASCQLQLPCDEDTFRTGRWKETFTLEKLSHRTLLKPEQHGTLAHSITMAYTLSRTAQYMLQQFNIRNRDPPWDANSDFASITSDLLYLENLLELHKSPSDLVSQWTLTNGQIDNQSVGPAIFSRALFHLCHCLLHHPFLLRRRLDSCQLPAPSSFLAHAFDTAWKHTKLLVRLLQETLTAGAITNTSFYGYCIVVAGTIAALHNHHRQVSKRTESSEILQTAMGFLDSISPYWNNASLLISALRNFSHNSLQFADLVTDSLVIRALTHEESEMLWMLVDYSAMSSAAHLQYFNNQDINAFFDTTQTWSELFAGMDSPVVSSPGIIPSLYSMEQRYT